MECGIGGKNVCVRQHWNWGERGVCLVLGCVTSSWVARAWPAKKHVFFTKVWRVGVGVGKTLSSKVVKLWKPFLSNKCLGRRPFYECSTECTFSTNFRWRVRLVFDDLPQSLCFQHSFRRSFDEVGRRTYDQGPSLKDQGQRTRNQGPTPSAADVLMRRDIMSCEPRHWMVCGHVVMAQMT